MLPWSKAPTSHRTPTHRFPQARSLQPTIEPRVDRVLSSASQQNSSKKPSRGAYQKRSADKIKRQLTYNLNFLGKVNPRVNEMFLETIPRILSATTIKHYTVYYSRVGHPVELLEKHKNEFTIISPSEN